MTNAGEGMERREPSYTVGWNEKWFLPPLWRTNGNTELPYDPGTPFLGIYSEKTLHSKIYTHPNVQSLGWEDLLEKGKAPHSGILAWRNPWTV